MSEKEPVQVSDKLSDGQPDVPGHRQPLVGDLREANEQLTLATLRADESAARYRDLVDDVDAIVWEADADANTWRFTFVSRRAQTILGYPVERWLQEPNFWIDTIHPEDRAQAVTTVRLIAADNKEIRIQYRALASNGRTVWLAMIAHVQVRDRGPAQIRGLIIDITESKRTEAKLQQLVRELETSRADLQEHNKELETFHDIAVDRELKMVDLEKEVERLQRELIR